MEIKWLFIVISVIILFGIWMYTGRHEPINTIVKPVELPDDLDSYLRFTEHKYTDIRPHTEKIILWIDPSAKQKTPVSIVYIHGFSATRQETAPLADHVAAKLNANLFYTRLTGHGRTGSAMQEGNIATWVNDIAEALAIGEKIGDKVVLMGASTGASLILWFAANGHLPNNVVSLVLLSPNLGPKQKISEILLWPRGNFFAHILIGSERQWQPVNIGQGKYWTTKYPVEALIPMMQTVKLARESELTKIKQPILILLSPFDNVIDPNLVENAFESLGTSKKRLIRFSETQDPDNHVIAGDIMSPKNTEIIASEIIKFLLEKVDLKVVNE